MTEDKLDQLLDLRRAVVEARTSLKVLSAYVDKFDGFGQFQMCMQDGGFELLPDSIMKDFMEEALEYAQKECELRENAFRDV